MFYGPLLFYFPEWAANTISIAFCVQAHTMWQVVQDCHPFASNPSQMLPAPSILQWLSLSKCVLIWFILIKLYTYD